MIEEKIIKLRGELGKYAIPDPARLQLSYNFAHLERETSTEDAFKTICDHLPKHYKLKSEVKDRYNMGGVGL